MTAGGAIVGARIRTIDDRVWTTAPPPVMISFGGGGVVVRLAC